MMNSIKRIALLAVLVVAVSLQVKAQFHAGISVMGSFPVSHMAEKGATQFGTNPYKGNAAPMGAGIGLRFQYDFSWRYNGIVSPIIDLEGYWNPKNQLMKDFSKETSFTVGHYINGSFMAGAMYRYFLNYQKPILGFFLEGAMGADVLYVTQEGWEGNEQIYKPSTAFAVRIGGGLCVTPQLNIGVHYEFLGNHKNIERKQQGEFTDRIDGELLSLYLPEKLKESLVVLKLTYIIKGNRIKHLPLTNSPL